jgi:hypothetical protein
MTTTQAIRRNMYFSVRNFFLINEATAKTIPFFSEKNSIFENALREIQTWSEMQKDAITGIAKEKKKLKESLIKISADYSKMLAAIAKFANNDKLMDKIRFRISDFKRMKDVELRDYSKIIYDNMDANIGKLAEYEITPETQKYYMDTINSYDSVLSTPRTVIAERSQTTKRLAGLFENADAALLELDFAIEAGQPKQPEFFNNYKAVRKIVDTGTGKLALRATAVDMFSGRPLGGAIFVFRPEGGKVAFTTSNGEIIKKTAARGIFHIKSIPAGAYKVSIQKTGYKAKDVSVTISDGERCDLKVELERLP